MSYWPAVVRVGLVVSLGFTGCKSDGQKPPVEDLAVSQEGAANTQDAEVDQAVNDSQPLGDVLHHLVDDGLFPGSYDSARTRFRREAQKLVQRYANVEVGKIDVPSDDDDDLTIDHVYVPAKITTTKLLIITAGVHGIEAFVGSAVIQLFIDKILPGLDLSTLGVLLVHAVNPWGYRHLRRVSEHNVDLNRNLDPDKTLFQTTNKGYRELNTFLNPTTPVTRENIQYGLIDVLRVGQQHATSKLQQAILQGQYEFPEGLYYGGKDFEPQKAPLEALFTKHIETYDSIFLADLHTGFGERSKLHLFGAPDLGDKAAMDKIFAGYAIDTGENNPDFYETTGDMIIYGGKLAEAKKKVYVGMTLEYGTLDSQELSGAAQSLSNMRLENQGHQHGYADPLARQQVMTNFVEMYNPSDKAWREAIIRSTEQMLPLLLERFIAL